MYVVEYIIGLLVVLITVVSVLFILVLPRQPQGLEKLTVIVNKSVHYSFVMFARMAKTYEVKDSILAPTAPVALIAQLLWWAVCLVLGFALMLMHTTHSFVHGLTQAVTSLFTVGAIHSGGAPNTVLDIAAGATWVVIVALQIAYLPSLYASFSRREALVTMLQSRAGSPAWGPELLARHQLVGINDALPQLYADWEQWAAEVTESHTTYPVLLLFRSPEPWLNWIIGLLAVLDAGAMQLALSPSTAPSQTRLCIRMGFTLFNRLAASLGYPVDDDPNPDSPIQLTYEEFASAVEKLALVGFPMERSAEEAWPQFRGWRINYEASAYRLADAFTAPLAPWSGTRRNLRAGVVEPRRPPHRAPAAVTPSGLAKFATARPEVINPPHAQQTRTWKPSRHKPT
ncbi:MAG: hypothetical protein ABSA22_11875 [Acidimicrobiales bacterium]